MPSLPRLSLRLSGAVDPRSVAALARRAEAAGFAALWLAENPFERGALPAAAAAALATSRVEIGVGVVNPYSRHPSLIAMEFAALDELSRGRALLGIGAGIGAAIERIGHSWDRPTSAVEDAIHIVRALLRGGEVSYKGRVFRTDGIRLGFRPLRPEMPILMAAVGDNSLRLSARIADGLIISNLSPLAYTERALAIVAHIFPTPGNTPPGNTPAGDTPPGNTPPGNTPPGNTPPGNTPPGNTPRGRTPVGSTRAGNIPARVVQYVPCALGVRREEARAIAKHALAPMLLRFWHNAEGRPRRRAAMVEGSGIAEPEFVSAVARLAQGDPAEAVLDDRFVEAFAIAGTAQDCRERAASYRRAGTTELALSVLGPDPARQIEALGRVWR